MTRTVTVPMAQYLAQLRHAEEWALAELRRLRDEGYEEVVPGVWQKGDTMVEF